MDLLCWKSRHLTFMEGYPIYEHDGGNWTTFLYIWIIWSGSNFSTILQITNPFLGRFSIFLLRRQPKPLKPQQGATGAVVSLFFVMEVSGFGKWWFNFSQQVCKTMGKYGKRRDIWLYLTMNIIWLVAWNMNGLWLFINIGNVIIPTVTHSIIFQRGRSTTNQINFSQLWKMLEDDKCARNVFVYSEGRCRYHFWNFHGHSWVKVPGNLGENHSRFSWTFPAGLISRLLWFHEKH